MATKLYRRSGFGDSDERPENVRKYAKEDWERFLYSMCEYVGVKFDWVSVGSLNEIINDDIPATIVSKYLHRVHQIQHFIDNFLFNRKKLKISNIMD